MACYEYLVVPAPRRGLKEKSLKGSEMRFAAAFSTVLNEHAADGWEYLRTDTLPSEEREGLMGRTTVFQNLLVFQRLKSANLHTPEAKPALIEDQSEAMIEDAPADPADATAPAGQDPAPDHETLYPAKDKSDTAAKPEAPTRPD